MIINAAGERSEQGRFLSKRPDSSNAVLGNNARAASPDRSQTEDEQQAPTEPAERGGRGDPTEGIGYVWSDDKPREAKDGHRDGKPTRDVPASVADTKRDRKEG